MNKLIAIAIAIFLVGKNTAKKGEIIDAEILTHMKLILKNCENY